jgi:hypothetical protein
MHRYSPALGPGGHFWQSYEENQVQKIRHRIYHTILKRTESTFVLGFLILLESIVDLEVIALFAWAPQPISGFYIVKSATRLINSGNHHIKNPDAVWIYAENPDTASTSTSDYNSCKTDLVLHCLFGGTVKVVECLADNHGGLYSKLVEIDVD